MPDDCPAPGARVTTVAASDLISRYRADFGTDGEANQTAHAGAMWHIIALAHLILAEIESLLGESGLSPADLFVLSVLLIERDRQLRPSDVAHILSVTPAALSQRLAKLEAKGLVERCGDGSDRRMVRLALTPAGQELARSLLARVGNEAQFSKALGKLDSDTRSELEATLSGLVHEMSRHVLR